MATRSSPNALDLFCGIGGLTVGLHRAGITSLGGIDCWDDAHATFSYNLAPIRCLLADVTTLTCDALEQFINTSLSEIDIVAGGPPCQGFSTVGKRDSSDPRNLLWKAHRSLVETIRPAYLLIENVEGILVMGKGAIKRAIIESFNAIGYHMKCRLLISADYGVPQLRKRAVFLGWLDGLVEPNFPRPLGQSYVSVGDAIFDLPELAAGQSAETYSRDPMTEYQRVRRNGCSVLSNHEAANHDPSLIDVISYVPDGGNRKSIPSRLQPKSGFHNSYSRLASWKPAVAVTSNMRKPSSARAVHPTQNRGLTVREGLRLQSFDDDFRVLGSRTSQYLQVGNAVPPLLGFGVGAEILRAFHKNTPSELRAARRMPAKKLRRSKLLFD